MAKHDDGLFYGLGLAALAGVGVATWLSSRPSGLTVAGSVPSVTPPDTFVNLSEVENRYREVVELYRMGYVSPMDARSEISVLVGYARALRAENPVAADFLVGKLLAFDAEIVEYLKTAGQA